MSEEATCLDVSMVPDTAYLERIGEKINSWGRVKVSYIGLTTCEQEGLISFWNMGESSLSECLMSPWGSPRCEEDVEIPPCRL